MDEVPVWLVVALPTIAILITTVLNAVISFMVARSAHTRDLELKQKEFDHAEAIKVRERKNTQVLRLVEQKEATYTELVALLYRSNTHRIGGEGTEDVWRKVTSDPHLSVAVAKTKLLLKHEYWSGLESAIRDFQMAGTLKQADAAANNVAIQLNNDLSWGLEPVD